MRCRTAGSSSVRGARDQPGAAAAGGEADRPADEDEEAVLEADQVEEMDDQPGDPGDEAAELDALDVGDGGGAADGGEVAFVAVAERRRSAALQAGADGLRGVASLLHGDGRDAGESDGRAVAAAGADHVAEREDLGMAGESEVRFDGDATGAVLVGAKRLDLGRVR